MDSLEYLQDIILILRKIQKLLKFEYLDRASPKLKRYISLSVTFS